MIETIAPELDQMVIRNPKVRTPPLFCLDRDAIVVLTMSMTSCGANRAIIVTTSSISDCKGKKLAMPMTKSRAGNRAKKK